MAICTDLTHRDVVLAEWIDANGHMNLAYYVVIFDRATDVLFEAIGVGAAYRAATGCSTFVVETHTRYERELRVDERVVVRPVLLGAAGKRLHFVHEMVHAEGGQRCATQELLAVHVDLSVRRAAAIPAALQASMAGWIGAAPDWTGGRIAPLASPRGQGEGRGPDSP